MVRFLLLLQSFCWVWSKSNRTVSLIPWTKSKLVLADLLVFGRERLFDLLIIHAFPVFYVKSEWSCASCEQFAIVSRSSPVIIVCYHLKFCLLFAFVHWWLSSSLLLPLTLFLYSSSLPLRQGLLVVVDPARLTFVPFIQKLLSLGNTFDSASDLFVQDTVIGRERE